MLLAELGSKIDRETVRKRALEEGFAKARFTRPELPDAMGQLQKFVDQGFHGQMTWMAERMNWRGDPSALWPEAKSVIVLAELYTPEEDPREVQNRPESGGISVYARQKDYHDIVKKRLKRLGRWLIEEAGGDTQIKVFVDTAPVMEKPLAQKSGLGWQGKHTNLLARDLGNWFFIGTIFTTLEFDPDPAEIEHCGSCRACLDACPTDAFPAPFQLDARRCISYLTIEHKGPVAVELREALGNRIYGCDDCLAACPWNKFAASATELRYAARDDLLAPPLAKLVKLDDAAFRTMFSGSPIKRIGRDRFIRNVLYAIGNSGEAALIEDAKALCLDPDETVRDAANWAVARLSQ